MTQTAQSSDLRVRLLWQRAERGDESAIEELQRLGLMEPEQPWAIRPEDMAATAAPDATRTTPPEMAVEQGVMEERRKRGFKDLRVGGENGLQPVRALEAPVRYAAGTAEALNAVAGMGMTAAAGAAQWARLDPEEKLALASGLVRKVAQSAPEMAREMWAAAQDDPGGFLSRNWPDILDTATDVLSLGGLGWLPDKKWLSAAKKAGLMPAEVPGEMPNSRFRTIKDVDLDRQADDLIRRMREEPLDIEDIRADEDFLSNVGLLDKGDESDTRFKLPEKGESLLPSKPFSPADEHKFLLEKLEREGGLSEGEFARLKQLEESGIGEPPLSPSEEEEQAARRIWEQENGDLFAPDEAQPSMQAIEWPKVDEEGGFVGEPPQGAEPGVNPVSDDKLNEWIQRYWQENPPDAEEMARWTPEDRARYEATHGGEPPAAPKQPWQLNRDEYEEYLRKEREALQRKMEENDAAWERMTPEEKLSHFTPEAREALDKWAESDDVKKLQRLEELRRQYPDADEDDLAKMVYEEFGEVPPSQRPENQGLSRQPWEPGGEPDDFYKAHRQAMLDKWNNIPWEPSAGDDELLRQVNDVAASWESQPVDNLRDGGILLSALGEPAEGEDLPSYIRRMLEAERRSRETPDPNGIPYVTSDKQGKITGAGRVYRDQDLVDSEGNPLPQEEREYDWTKELDERAKTGAASNFPSAEEIAGLDEGRLEAFVDDLQEKLGLEAAEDFRVYLLDTSIKPVEEHQRRLDAWIRRWLGEGRQ